jgi:hypothetical protein
MQLESLICNSCGAPLEVPLSAQYVTCVHCSTQLQIRRTGSVTCTEQLADLTEKTEELSERIDNLATDSKRSEIDSKWQIERESFMVKDGHGNSHIPTKGSSVASGIMVTVFGVFWVGMAIAITSSAPSSGPFAAAKVIFPAFGVLFIGFGIYTSRSNFEKAEKYKRAERRYHQRRDEADRS